jgi:hypothetical protein
MRLIPSFGEFVAEINRKHCLNFWVPGRKVVKFRVMKIGEDTPPIESNVSQTSEADVVKMSSGTSDTSGKPSTEISCNFSRNYRKISSISEMSKIS